MNEWNKALIGDQAKALGFNRDTYEKVCRLIEVLKFFENDTLLSHSLALKGGTAINLLYFDLPRLSVDIDLDFVGHVDRDEMMTSRKRINELIQLQMKASGYSLSSKSKFYHALDSYVFDYTNTGGVKDNIKVEINYMLRCHVLDLKQKGFTSEWEADGVSVLSVDLIEIFASKIVALMSRTAVRDVYDVYNIVRSEYIKDFDRDLLRKLIVFYTAIGSNDPSIHLPFLKMSKIDPYRIKTDLLPVLRKNERFNLIEAKDSVLDWLENLMQLDAREIEFLDAFSRKSYRPDLLFDSKERLDRISVHPMALWKCSQK